MRKVFTQIGKTIAIDHFLPHPKDPSRWTNYPQHVSSPVVEYWHKPSDNPLTSGEEFVKVEDGRIFTRYDCYMPESAYGWKSVINTTELQKT